MPQEVHEIYNVNPYPSVACISELETKFGISKKKLRKFFQNKRAADKMRQKKSNLPTPKQSDTQLEDKEGECITVIYPDYDPALFFEFVRPSLSPKALKTFSYLGW